MLDDALLLMPLCKFIAPTDPRWISTLDAITAELVSDSLVYRYTWTHRPTGSPVGRRPSRCARSGGWRRSPGLGDSTRLGASNDPREERTRHHARFLKQRGLPARQAHSSPVRGRDRRSANNRDWCVGSSTRDQSSALRLGGPRVIDRRPTCVPALLRVR